MKNITIEQLGRLSDPYFHKEIGVETKWRIGDGAGAGKNAIFPYYTADQCREILDAVCGITGWGNEYREVAGYLFAVIGISVEGQFVEKSDAGGARGSTKGLSGEDKDTWNAKTAASSSFVRAAKAWGIGRHHDLLPKMILPVKNRMAYTLEGQPLEGPEALSAYCNATSTAAGYLYWIYNLEKAKFAEGSRGLELLAELKTILTAE